MRSLVRVLLGCWGSLVTLLLSLPATAADAHEISGRVTDAVSERPLVSVLVHVIASDGGLAGDATTDGSGRYEVRDLPAGAYYVRTAEYTGEGLYQDELYDDIPCPLGRCSVIAGALVVLGPGDRVAGIDFGLVPFGAISGRVVDELTGEPIADIRVLSQEADPGPFDPSRRHGTSGDDGRFTVRGVIAGSHYLGAVGDGYRDEFFDGVPCERGCDLAGAVPIAVELATTTSGIEFTLEPIGAISGRVTDALTGEPIVGLEVQIQDAAPTFFLGSRTDEDGSYHSGDLEPGTHFVSTASFEYANQVYDGIPCNPGCDPAAGTPVEVLPGAETTGIDFAVEALGAISGRIVDAVTGDPAFVDVLVFDPNGSVVAFAEHDGVGSYRAAGLASGTYFVRTAGIMDSYDSPFEDQLYQDIPCPRRRCDPTTGTPVEVARRETTSGIDFSLEPGGVIEGGVTDAVSGAPVADLDLTVWDASGSPLAFGRTDAEGRYRVDGLGEGTYFVSTSSQSRYLDELYMGLPCPGGACDPTAGTPIEIQSPFMIWTVDFALEPLDPSACAPSETALCLSGGRFRVESEWEDFEGHVGRGRGGALSGDTGYFWFFEPTNVELLIKVLDACADPFNRFWVFAAGLTNVGVTLTVTDTATDETRTYANPTGLAFEPVQDTDAFAGCAEGRGREGTGEGHGLEVSVAEAPEAEASETCTSGPHAICLNGGRFLVEARWRTRDGDQGQGFARPLTGDTAYFWFFDPANAEILVKVLDACGDPFDRFWVFAAGLTNVEVTLRVTDTVSGQVREYRNPQDTPFEPIQDTRAFATCP